MSTLAIYWQTNAAVIGGEQFGGYIDLDYDGPNIFELEGNMETIEMKQNDRHPRVAGTCRNPDGSVIDLTGATVVFHMWRRSDRSVKISGGSCTILDATAGRVAYEWGASDTDTAGIYEAEFQVTFSDSKKQTFPGGDHYLPVVIGDDIVT